MVGVIVGSAVDGTTVSVGRDAASVGVAVKEAFVVAMAA